jgi:dihydrofolate reductase
MRKLTVFNSITLDGYFTGKGGDLSWAHRPSNDPEWDAFVAGNASGGGTLLMGRVTYEMMVAYWPTPQAHEQNPAVADPINRQEKVVFSRTLDKVSWNNTKLVKDDLVETVRRMKGESGSGMTILGSGSIVAQLTQAQLTQAGLIDEYQVVVIPVVLGDGRTMFEGLEKKLDLKLLSSRTFKNGNVLLGYSSAGTS